MNQDDLKFARLKENPFHVTPGDRVEVWAGLHQLRELLVSMVTVVRNDKVGTSEFVVLHGELGTGKSHALRYLQTMIDETRRDEFASKCIYLESLRVADKPTFLEVYRTILNRIGRNEIQNLAKALVARIDNEAANMAQTMPEKEIRKLAAGGNDGQKKLRSEAIKNVLERHSRAYPLWPLWEKLAQEDDDAWLHISANKQKGSRGRLKSLEVDADIATDYEAVGSLAMIINLACGINLNSGRTFWKAFYLLVDEVEIMTGLEPKVIIALNQAFRDLLNGCPEHLCLMFGLTGEAADVEITFATALLDRMTRPPIEIPTLDTDQSLDFIKEVLRFSRPSKSGKEDADLWHPFTKQAIEYIIENTPTKTPRHLFMAARKVLLLAAEEGILQNGKKIGREDAERLLI